MSQTVYYVTLRVAAHGRHPFGTIQNGQIQLSEAGRVTAAYWQQLASAKEQVHLDAFVIMPNHLHGLIMFGTNTASIGTGFMGSGFGLTTVDSKVAERPETRLHLHKLIDQFIEQSVNALRVDITESFWHHPYDVQWIQNEKKLNALRHAIYKNPVNWLKDPYYSPPYTDQDTI